MQQFTNFNYITVVVLLCIITVGVEAIHPHIVFIMSDDMGWNDVAMHGSNQILTPNIDALGYNGVILNKHYTMHICTPSRSAFLTGKHPIRAGMQGIPLVPGEPRALPTYMPTMAEHLQALGYRTHMVGKWHLGFHNKSVCPVGRGFDSHIGYWSGFVGYFDYEINNYLHFNGYDLHRNYKPAYEHAGKYATQVFTEEAIKIIEEHPVEDSLFLVINHLAAHTGKDGTELGVMDVNKTREQYSYIDGDRQLYAGVVTHLDDSVGQTLKALADKNILKDTIVIFISDNGAPTTGIYANSGSNWPFRGQKQNLYEGGVRNTAVMWASQLLKKQYVDNNLFHITDWLPTLYAAAGGDVNTLGDIDGVNHWPRFTRDQLPIQRKDVLLNIDEKTGHKAILSYNGRYKLLKGADSLGLYDGYYGDTGRNGNEPEYNITAVLNSDVNTAISGLTTTETPVTVTKILSLRGQLKVDQSTNSRRRINCITHYCLFDLQVDPTETIDVSLKNPAIVKNLFLSLAKYAIHLIPQRNKIIDPKSNPKHCNNTWFPWRDPVLKCDL